MNNSQFVSFFILFSAVSVASEKPNVLVILTDDQGWGDLSLHGNPHLKTPNIDSIATQGTRFERFYVQPVCSPTRAEFLTGRWHLRGGVVGVSTGGERLNLDETTIADSFKAAGYATACIGKWHNGSQYPYHPNGRGFDEFYGFTHGHWGDYFSPPLEHNGNDVVGEGFIADDFTNKAMSFMNVKRDKPFFCYLAYNTPHSPMQVPDEDWNRWKDREGLSPHTRAAYAMVENLDRNIGRIMKTLPADTIVVYFHDNGPNGKRFNGVMKGVKGSTDEGGVRSPLFIRWPGTVKENHIVHGVSGAIDLLPTLCELCGVHHVGSKSLDGVSFAKHLTGESNTIDPHRVLFNHWNGKISARSSAQRLDSEGKLYEMDTDPEQAKPVDNPVRTAYYRKLVENWKSAMPSRKDERLFPVGWSELPRAVLWARDGVPNGGVRRSANAPNCSYFTGFQTGSAVWNIDVHADGDYEVVVQTTAKAAAKVAVKIHDAMWNGEVPTHDPKPFGPDHDRVPRVGESAMKIFIRTSIGTHSLKKGPATLTLTAAEGMDVQAVEVVKK